MILKNCMIIQDNGELLKQDIEITDGIISSISDVISGSELIDLCGKLLMPGLIDVHVHLREPGYESKETIKSGSLAGAMGGFTTICAMPNTNPVVDTGETLDKINSIIKKDALVHVHQFAAITQGLTSDDLVDIEGMDAIGYSNDGRGIQSSATMLKAMRALKKHNKILIAHTEDDDILFSGVMHEGIRNKELGLPGILSAVESSQIARDLVLAHESKVKYHVCHVSSKESVAMIGFAKQIGVDVSCEVSPHHLLLNEMDVLSDDSVHKMNPPLRSLEDQNALLEGLKSGAIDMIATDHAPHTEEEKKGGFMNTPFGIIGLELAFPLLYTKLVLEDKLSLKDLKQFMVLNPKERFELKGSDILVGSPADLAVFDLDTERIVSKSLLGSKSSNTPFMGEALKGFCVMTLVDGKIVYQGEQI